MTPNLQCAQHPPDPRRGGLYPNLFIQKTLQLCPPCRALCENRAISAFFLTAYLTRAMTPPHTTSGPKKRDTVHARWMTKFECTNAVYGLLQVGTKLSLYVGTSHLRASEGNATFRQRTIVRRSLHLATTPTLIVTARECARL